MIGQRKLLKWTIPGLAHAFTFWGFLVLGLTIVEAYGALFTPDFSFPLIGHWAVVGFLEDFFAVAVLAGAGGLHRDPLPAVAGDSSAARSRFFGSHTGAAWLVLFMIFT